MTIIGHRAEPAFRATVSQMPLDMSIDSFPANPAVRWKTRLWRHALGLAIGLGVVIALASLAEAAFGVTKGGGLYTVDTGAGLDQCIPSTVRVAALTAAAPGNS